MSIHPTAIVSPKANLGNNVSVGPFAIIEDNTTIGDNSSIAASAIIRSGATLGQNVSVDSFAVISGLPQDISFNPSTPTGVTIDDNTIIRESVTVHRATKENTNTTVGANTLLFANAHVAHDCSVGDHTIIGNGVLLAGHVTVQNYAYLGGNSVYHQYITIGEGAITAGRSGINLDIPPFLMVTERNQVHGLNLIPLRRRGFTGQPVTDLKEAFSAVLNTPGSPYKNAETARANGLGQTELANTFLSFFNTRGKKGCVNQTHLQIAK